MALLFLCLIFGTGRTQKIEAADTETDQAAAAQDELLAELDFDAIQQEVDSLLSSQQFSFAGTVRSLLQDGDPFRTFRAGNAVLSCAKTAFLAQKGLMKELFLLVLAGAVLGSFSSLFEGKQVRDASFYMVYLLALALILKNFQSSGENCSDPVRCRIRHYAGQHPAVQKGTGGTRPRHRNDKRKSERCPCHPCVLP